MPSTDPLLEAIQSVRDDVRANHEALTRRLEQMVSKDTHEAEVRRIDAELVSQKRAFDSHVQVYAQSQAELKRQVVDGDQQILQRLADYQSHQSEKDEERAASAKSDRHWLLGWMASLAGVFVAAAAFLSRFF